MVAYDPVPNCCSIALCTLLANTAAVVTVLVSPLILLILLLPGIVEHAVAVAYPGFTLVVTLLLVPLLLSAIIGSLILVITLLIGALVLRPAIAVLIVLVVLVVAGLLIISGVSILLRTLLVLPRPLMLHAWVIVVLLDLALLAVDARRLAIRLPIWLYDYHPRLRLIDLSIPLVHSIVRAGIGVVGTTTK